MTNPSSNNDLYFGKDLEALSFATNYYNWILEEFSPFLGKDIAEIGAGIGNFSRLLLKRPIRNLVAFEPSRNMFPLLQKNLAGESRVRAINGFFEDHSAKFNNHFDTVCYINVLEHIEDDRGALCHAHSTLKDSGHLLIFVPALSFLYSELDKKVGHVRRYSKGELVDVVSSAGFSIKKAKYFDILGIIPWFVAFVLLKQIPTKANVSLYDKLVVPLIKPIERALPPPIGKNLVLVAQKAG
ncbi:MAG: class I SAM-dependent methyltransferase [Thermodesulfobacteria bacterium]|nr:class I SAM-dependent methyltransferase [Thermodesulfobacteriota bacterium]